MMRKCNEYVEALEVERRKIQVFQRELPLCLQLVSQAIDTCRQQLSASSGRAETSHECFRGRQQSECSEQTSSHVPVLEQFIPVKPVASCTSVDGGDDGDGDGDDDESGEKSDWLRSVQLWNNQSPDPAPVPQVKKNVGAAAFRLFDKENVVVEEVVDRPLVIENKPKPASSSTVKNKEDQSATDRKSGQTQRKQRRCWSPELHKRFIHSLQQLGGPHVATPKQIKELMKVDGLTNDEVKSHLQKYRLHMRRPSASTMPSSSGNAQASQFVVVGGIWVPPPDCSVAGVTPASTTSSGDLGKAAAADNIGVYAPLAIVGTPFAQPASKSTHDNKERSRAKSRLEEDGSHSSAHGSGTRTHSNSPASSSSTHTNTIATASPLSS